ncbi:cytochrome c biogenesis CcdA family protein [candidate division KSB1 bacterium]
MATDISIFAAFFAGIISFFSPCVLPLIPAYVSYITGISFTDLTEKKGNLFRIFISSLTFVLGFSVIFILLGASATFVSAFLVKNLNIIGKIAGVIIVIFGLHLIGIIRIKFLLYEKKVHSRGTKVSLLGTFIMGLAFAFGWTPCVGPILAGILAIAATKSSILNGVVLLAFYSAGLGIPFILTALATSTFVNLFGKVKKHFRKIEIISGVFLILVGILIFFNMFGRLSAYLVEWFPFLAEIG